LPTINTVTDIRAYRIHCFDAEASYSGGACTAFYTVRC
jgi:hypothetical protein